MSPPGRAAPSAVRGEHTRAVDPGLRTPRFSALPPLSLYVHIPWCMKKCPYCDFNSHERRGDVPEAQYVDALIADLESALPSIWGRRVETVFFGGGTPSLFSAVAIDRILAAVRARVPLSPDAEVTLEVIRAPSSRTSSRTSRQPASIACRWVCKLRS